MMNGTQAMVSRVMVRVTLLGTFVVNDVALLSSTSRQTCNGLNYTVGDLQTSARL